jgi:hypothetical protein
VRDQTTGKNVTPEMVDPEWLRGNDHPDEWVMEGPEFRLRYYEHERVIDDGTRSRTMTPLFCLASKSHDDTALLSRFEVAR